MKKRILMTLVTLTLLSSMILCALLGVTKAEYFKILSKDLSFEAKPDLELEYYIYHAKKDDPNTTTNESLVYAPERGTYKDAENFIQWLRPGHLTSSEVVEKTNENGTGGTNVKSGKEMVYQIKVPVNETGYYTLDFLTYILFGNDKEGASYLSTDFYTISYRYCLGCEVLTQSDNIEFGTNTPLDMPNRVFADDSERKDRSEEKVLYSDSVISNNSAIPKDSVYQWKTLCPYRAENVSLTFKAEQSDVDKGYVIWAWDFTGLEAGLNYALYVEGLSVNKRMELDGTTKYRDSNTPYFMFPQTAYVNNIVDKNGNTNNDTLGAGRNRWSSGRGTYVTEATDNSLGMRAELLWGGANKQTDNPVSLYIPLKNVQRGATYKVTFDFSVARQGFAGITSAKSNGAIQAGINTATPSTSITDWHNYNGDVSSIFDNSWSNAANADNRIFQSYLISGDLNTVASLSRNGHRNSQDLITYNNKHYSSYNVTSGSNQYTYGYPLTKYDEVVKYNAKHWDSLTSDIDHTTSSNINDTYSIDVKHDGESTYTSTSMRNFFNAVQHTEYNGQYEINWVTFYNTTFSFNIASDANLDELYWVWAIDALRYTAFYNLRIENVRIERVVDFASELNVKSSNGSGTNGVKIGGNEIGTAYMNNYGQTTSDGGDQGPFNNYRGWNSTGQNYQARGHATTTYLPKGNIYAPIVDASRFTLTNDFTIKLDGKAVLKGGVDRYVYSIDGGRTWADMEFSGGKASADQLADAEAGIDLSVKGQSETSGGADMIEFDSGDASNASFDNFALSVDLKKYKNQANIDIIIAAVPNDHPDYRCEILRIVNFNQIKNYVSFPYDFVSDIKVTNKIYNTNGETTPLNAHRIKDDSTSKGHYYYSLAKAEGTGFTQMKTVRLDTKVPTSTTAYARMGAYSYAYEDVRAAWTGFAVKNTLGFTGWAIVESGIQKYVWSADGGKTWSDCSGTPKTRNLVNTGYKKMFYDGSEAFGDELKELHDFEDSINGLFSGVHADHGSMLTADLSGYVGEVVDVIFAAKPKDSEVCVPIGRVDNVAVYGDPKLPIGTVGRGMGTFCTQMHEVRIDDQTYQHGISMSLRYDPTDYSNSFARMNWIADMKIGIETATLNYLEPYHVNPVNARFYNETVQEIKSGGKIEIEGFTVVEGGVKQYKYSLDGGETWTILHTTQQGKYSDMVESSYNFKTQALAAANACGISLDGNNGNNISYTHPDNAWLVVNLPALPAGVEKNLLVVAESNIDNGEKNADGTSKGKGFIYPVLHMKIRIKNDGVGYFLNDANSAQAGRYTSGNISQTFKAGENATYKLTFPIAQEGVHTLTFNAQLNNDGVTSRKENVDIYQAWDVNVTKVGTGTATMSVNKTHFVEGEAINVSYSTSVNGTRTETGAGVLGGTVICIARLDDNGNLIRYSDNKVVTTGGHPHYELAQVIVPTTDNIKNGMSERRSGVVNLRDGLNESAAAIAVGRPSTEKRNQGSYTDLPAGRYRIFFYNDESIRFGNVVQGITDPSGLSYGLMLLTDPIDITIYADDKFPPSISVGLLHEQTEKGGERYFASKEAVKTKGGTVDNVAKRTLDNAFTAQDVDFYFNATAEDVKRGYVVLDFDLSGLTDNTEYVLNIDNLMYSYGVKSTKRLVTDEHGNASYTIRVPALEVGTHEFAFSSYASSYGSIIHKGLNQTVCQGYTNRGYGGDYLTAGAFMSVEKNIFTVGEPIHVSYNTAGAGTCLNPNPSNNPWIGITTKDDEGRDTVIGKVYLEKNAVGKVTFRSGMYGCTNVNDELAHLPAGDYKIYFRDNSANIYGDIGVGDNIADNKGEYWPQMNITDPIAITIIDPNKSNEKPYKQTYYFDDVWYDWLQKDNIYKNKLSGWVSIDKTVFRVGEDISFDCEKREPVGNPKDNQTVYLAFYDPVHYNGSYFNDYYYGFFEEKIIDVSNAKYDPDPGRYQLYCCDQGFSAVRTYGAVMGVFDIVVLPQMDHPSTLTMSYDHLKKNDAEQRVPYDPISAYDYSRNSISIDITQADVDRGYVEFEYELTGLVKEEEVIYTTEMFYDRPIEKEPYTIEGDYVLFGEYPQSLKPNGVTIPEGTNPDNRGYYKGSDGNYYVKVIANPFGNDYVFDNGTTKIENATVYYFKVEPIRWRILKAEGSSYMDLICDSIIMNGAYDVDSNNYALSDIRAWLNKTFYETAFTEFQRSYIMSVTVDNSLASTGYSSNPYVSENTNDKIYLPSYDDAINTSYGFMPNASDWDTNRAKHVTDYAKATGAFANMSQYDGNFANGIWMLRSPANSASYFIRECYYNGEITDGGININLNAHGVVPMLRLATASNIATWEVYKIIEKDVGSSSTYRFNYSALFDGKQTRKAFDSDFAGSYMSVDKTYFLPGEPINVTYFATGSTINNNAWIGIADLEKDQYIYWARITKGTKTEIDLSHQHDNNSVQNPNFPNLEPGKEYKIWLLANNYWWDYSKDGDAHYMNPYKDGKIVDGSTINANAITEPICIKILDPNENDYSLEYKAWIGADTNGNDQMGATYSYIMLERNTFVQGEPIKMKFNGRTQYMWAWLCDENGNEIPKTYTDAAKITGVSQELTGWTEEYYEMENSKNLAPGKYKLYYAVYSNNGMENVYKAGAIVAIIDITILPQDIGQSPTLKLDVVYTNTSGQTVRQTINNNVLLNNLLNSHPGNYDLTDDDNKIEGIVELTGVKPNSKIQFYFSYKTDSGLAKDDSIQCTAEEVKSDSYDIKYSSVANFSIRKDAFTYVPTYGQASVTKYPNATMTVKGTYFVKGQPIMADYVSQSYSDDNKSPFLIITTESLHKDSLVGDSTNKNTKDKKLGLGSVYMTCVIRWKNLSSIMSGSIDLNSLNNWQSPFIQGNPNAYDGELPVGTYKVWMFDNAGDILDSSAFGLDPFKTIAPYLMTEPITFKVIDPNNPDFTIKSESYAPYSGTLSAPNKNTRVTIEKNVFQLGEKIYFKTGMDYGARQVMITPGLNSNTSESTRVYDLERPYNWQYAEHGQTDIGTTGWGNYLDTSKLGPGQYKIYYFMGENVQKAYRGASFTLGGQHSTYCKIYTIIDIIILPTWADQTVTINYTKYDGSPATINKYTADIPVSGKLLSTTQTNGKVTNRWHLGINYTQSLIDEVKPGTTISITATNDFAGTSWEAISLPPTILESSAKKRNS